MNVTYFNFKEAPLKLNATQEFYERLRALLTIKKVIGKNFVRLGKHNDGGYIMVDNFSAGDVTYSLPNKRRGIFS